MIEGLQPYAEYKESGLPWVAGLPRHWRVNRLRHASEMLVSNVDKHTKPKEIPVRLCNYVDVYKNERIHGALRFMRATATKDEVERFRLRRGDVVITKDSEEWTDIGVPTLIEYEAPDFVCGYHLAILRPRPAFASGAFLHRTLQCSPIAAQFHVEAHGVTRYGLSHGAINDLLLPLPPPDEQAAIVRFLDHANRKIDGFIRAKRKLIGLLGEQKQAIIHRAVTKVSTSDCKTMPVRTVLRPVKRMGFPNKMLLSLFRDYGVIPKDSRENKNVDVRDLALCQLVNPGDVVMNKMKAWQGSIAVSGQGQRAL